PCDLLMRLAKCGPLADEFLRRVRGKHARVARRSGQALAVELQVLDEDGRRLQAVECVVDRRKEGWFVLLKIAVVRQRQALQRGGERDERTERSRGTAAEELGEAGAPTIGHQ